MTPGFFDGGDFLDPFLSMGPASFQGGTPGGSAGPSSAYAPASMSNSFIFQPGGSAADRAASWIVPGLLAGVIVWIALGK